MVLQGKIWAYFMTIGSILQPLEIFYGHLVYFVVIWYIFPFFGILYQEKFGNPDRGSEQRYLHAVPGHVNEN
jgi:preprotein translocase subunit SecY